MNPSALAWLYLISAAGSEVAWAYSLKYLSLAGLKTLRWSTFYRPDGGWSILLPWLAYFVFGVLTSVLLAGAMRTLPTALTLAVWMASSLLFTKLVDIIWLKVDWSVGEVFFGFVILIGLIGFKLAQPVP